MKWQIFYDNNTTFTDLDGSPEDAPIHGVQVIMEYHDNNTKNIHHGADYYCWLDGSWGSGNQKDLDRWLSKRPVPKLIVLLGRWMNHIEYRKVVDKAMLQTC